MFNSALNFLSASNLGPSMSFFSIIVPTFNSEKDIVTCCLSIINQTFRDYEIIIQDGLSTDGTLYEINKLQLQYPDILLNVASEHDIGIYDAMNRATLRSLGKWVLFLGSDDQLFDKNVLSSASSFLQHTTAMMVYGNVKIIGGSVWANDTIIYDGPFSPEKLFEKNICHQAIFYNRSIFEKLGFFNPKFSICADWDFNFRCFAKADVMYMDLVVSFFSGGGISNTGADKFKEESIFILKDYFGIGYFNHLFKTYTWVFLSHSIAAFKQRRFSRSLYFLRLSFYHTDNKILLSKIVLRKLIGK